MNPLRAFKDWQESRRDNEHEQDGFVSLNLKAASSLPQQTYGAGNWGNQWVFNYPNTKINFSQEVGDLRNSSLVMSAVGWLARSLYDARLRVITKGVDQKETEVEDHELPAVFDRPNPFYSCQSLLAGIALSWIMKSEAYVVKVRGGYGNVIQLWWEPHWTIEPRWDKAGKDLISYYEINRDGRWIRLEVEDVIAIRNGIDPITRHGLLNPEAALLREYFTDNQIAQLCAVMFKKGLVPPGVVGLGDKEFHPDATQVKEFRSDLLRRMSGDSAGEMMVVSGAVDFKPLGFDYSKFGFRDMRKMPEERFCAAMGISPHSLNLGAAESASTYNNVKQYLMRDYRGYVVPLQRLIAKEFDVQLLPDFGDSKKANVNWDYSQTFVLQSDKVIETTNTTRLYEKDIIDRAEAREAVGYKMRPEDKGVYYSQSQKSMEEVPEQPVDPNLPPTKAKADIVPGKVLDDSADYWREHPELNKQARSLMDAEPYVNGKAN